MSNLFGRISSFFARQSTLQVLDKLVKNEYALLLGLAIYGLVLWQDWWSWIEPLLTLVVLPVAAATWFEHWRARHRRYSADEVGDFVIVAVEVNNDTASSIHNHFGRSADVTVRSQQAIGKTTLSPEDCTRLAKIVAQRCAPYRNVTIKLVLAGPAGLCFQIGQLLPAHKFDVVPLSWNRGMYDELSRLGTDDIGGVS